MANFVESSVRKLGNRVRINVQLIDAKTGGHVWADGYDGSLTEAFELQDRVCSNVVSALSINLTQPELERVSAVHTTNIEAYEVFVQAQSTPFSPTPARRNAVAKLSEQVAELAPDFSGGYAGLARTIGIGAL